MSDHEASLRQRIERLDLADSVRFVGPQPQGVLPTYYVASDVTVLPSYYESFGMVALEAMACGSPVIASRVGGLVTTVATASRASSFPTATSGAGRAHRRPHRRRRFALAGRARGRALGGPSTAGPAWPRRCAGSTRPSSRGRRHTWRRRAAAIDSASGGGRSPPRWRSNATLRRGGHPSRGQKSPDALRDAERRRARSRTSPTSATVLALVDVQDTSSTARTTPLRVTKCVWRFLTSRRVPTAAECSIGSPSRGAIALPRC